MQYAVCSVQCAVCSVQCVVQPNSQLMMHNASLALFCSIETLVEAQSSCRLARDGMEHWTFRPGTMSISSNVRLLFTQYWVVIRGLVLVLVTGDR